MRVITTENSNRILLTAIMLTFVFLVSCSLINNKPADSTKEDNIKVETETADFIKQFSKPVIQPIGEGFESERTYNPTFAILDGKTVYDIQSRRSRYRNRCFLFS